jgi:hypothetical protein
MAVLNEAGVQELIKLIKNADAELAANMVTEDKIGLSVVGESASVGESVSFGTSVDNSITLEANGGLTIEKGNDNKTIKVSHTLSSATSNALGGIKIGYTKSGQNYPVVLDTNQRAYVNVPWTDTNTTYNISNGSGTSAIILNKNSGGTAEGNYAVSSGRLSTAAGDNSTAMGYNCIVTVAGGHAEGNTCRVEGAGGHAEGCQSYANGTYSHGGGHGGRAYGYSSFAHGWWVEAKSDYQTVFGKYNVNDTN